MLFFYGFRKIPFAGESFAHDAGLYAQNKRVRKQKGSFL